MIASPERSIQSVAWTVIWMGFLALVAIVVLAALGARWYISNATIGRSAEVTVATGTVWLQEPGQGGWGPATTGAILQEGTSIRTVESSEAMVTLFDRSTVLLFPNSELDLSELRARQFAGSEHSIVLAPRVGRLRISVAPTVAGSKSMVIRVPGGEAALDDGVYNVAVDAAGLVLTVQERGSARVSAQGTSVDVSRGERVALAPGAEPSLPIATREELIQNGEFRGGLDGWRADTETLVGFNPGQDVPGEITAVEVDGRSAVQFSRRGSQGNSAEPFIIQEVDRDVSGYSRLTLEIELKLLHQSLSGGGYLGSEYPVILQVNFIGGNGREDFRVYGFYYQNDNNRRTDNGNLVPQDEWVTFTVPDNLAGLASGARVITSIQVSASGWDFESLVRRVSLVGD